MNQFDDLHIYTTTVDLHGFTAAAGRLGLSKQFVSRRVGALEARLGVRLLTRTTRKLAVTDLGRIYYERARQILQDVSDADLAVSSQSGQPRGLLRLSAPMTFSTMHLSALVPRFLLDHPQVSLEMDLNDRTVDVVGEGYDMALRIGALADSSLIARLIAPVPTVLCCSPAYRETHGVPATPAALAGHECIQATRQRSGEWRFLVDGREVAVGIGGRLRYNNGELARDAAVAGLGIVRLPRFMVADALRAGQLETLLDDFRPPDSGLYALYPQHRQASLIIRAFIDFLAAAFAAGLD